MRIFNWKPSVVLFVGLAVALVGVGVGGAASHQAMLPMPKGTPDDAVLLEPSDLDLPEASGGPYLPPDRVRGIALNVAASYTAKNDVTIEAVVLTTHGKLIEQGVFSPSFSVGESREVYLVTLRGSFIFTRRLAGHPPFEADYINIEIDASTGIDLATGTSKATQSEEVLAALNIASGTE